MLKGASEHNQCKYKQKGESQYLDGKSLGLLHLIDGHINRVRDEDFADGAKRLKEVILRAGSYVDCHQDA